MAQEFEHPDKPEQSSLGFLARLGERFSSGDIGSLPVLLGLIVIAIIFQLANSNFLTPLNLTNLLVQIASMGMISVGIVLVLLIGEIDLSVGAVSGLSAAIMAVISVKFGYPAWAALIAGVLAGAAIGLLQGWWFARLHVPSFIVTLAGFLGWQGALLFVLGSTGTINLNAPLITGMSNYLVPVLAGWIIGVGGLIIYWFITFNEYRRRVKAGIATFSLTSLIIRNVITTSGRDGDHRHHERQPQPGAHHPHPGHPAGGADLCQLCDPV